MATIGALVWRVAADTSELKENVRSVESQLTKMGSAGEKVGSMLRQAFTVGALVGLAKTAVDAGDAIGDLSARAKVSAEAFQRITTVLQPAGVEAEAFTQSILFMQRALAGDNKSAAAAVSELGLKVADLRAKSPDQAFLDIAEAVAAIEDPMQRSRIETELFGKAGSKVAAGFTTDIKAATAAVDVMSNDAVEGMGKLSDAWDKLLRDGKRLIAEVLTPLVPALTAVGSAISYLVDGVTSLARKVPEMIGPLGALGKMRDTWDLLRGNLGTPAAPKGVGLTTGAGYSAPAMSEADTKIAIDDLTDQARKTTESQRKLAQSSDDAAEALSRQAALAKHMAWDTAKLVQLQPPTLGWNGGGGYLNTVGDLSLGGLNSGRINTGAMGYDGFQLTKVPGLNMKSAGLSGLMSAMPWLAGLVTGGSKSAQVGGTVGGTLGGVIGSSSMFGGLAGMGGFAGVLGAAAPFLGPALGLVGGLVGKLFGPSKGAILGQEADQRIGQTQAGLLQQYGSVANIAGMNESGAALAAAWGSKNVAGEANFNKLVESFEKQRDLEQQIVDLESQRAALVEALVPKYQDVVNAAQTLGISTDSLGPKIDQLAANASWGEIVNALDTVFRAGADVGGVLEQSSGKLTEMARKSIELGTTIPANMRPYYEELDRSGKLLDANGKKIVDITQIKWGDAIETEAGKTKKQIDAIDLLIKGLKDAIQIIVDSLANKLPAAAADGARGLGNVQWPTVRIPWKYEQEGDAPPGAPGFASGSGGVRDFGRGTLAVLHGREAVLTEAQLRAGAAAGSGVNVTINVAGYLDSPAAQDRLASIVQQRIGFALRMGR